MIRLRLLAFALVVLAALPAVGHAEVPDADRAAWTAAAHEDPDAALNLGVAAAREGDIGHAVLWLERAHRLAPLDRTIGDALLASQREARRLRAEAMPRAVLVEGEPAGLSSWRFFGAVPSALVVFGLVAASWVLFGALFVARSVERRGIRDAAIVVAVLAGLAGLVFGGLRIGAVHTSRSLTPGVVVDASPTGREAPDELSPPRREANLYPGALTLITAVRDDWYEVELVDGARIWVRPDVVTPIVAPEPVTSPR